MAAPTDPLLTTIDAAIAAIPSEGATREVAPGVDGVAASSFKERKPVAKLLFRLITACTNMTIKERSTVRYDNIYNMTIKARFCV